MEDRRAPADVQPPPRTWTEMLRHLGPGLIVTGSIVGSGELIVTTGLGAKTGFILLWLIVLGCLLKLFVQVELGRYVVSEGVTTLEAMDGMPGPRLVVSWLLWVWLIMFVALFFQLAGIIGAIAQVLQGFGARLHEPMLALLVAFSGIVLLASGRYKFAEVFTTGMVFLFTACTLFAAVAIQWTPYAITGSDLHEMASFRLPESFVWAFSAFGITGVGAAELIYYPYWCLEKGYARHVGPKDGSPEWASRARGWVRTMEVDAWFSLVIYTTATVAFYFLGAAILHEQNPGMKDEDLIPALSAMYEETFGASGLWIFLTGAFFVLYSTFFVATASNARLLADALSVFKLTRYRSPVSRLQVVRASCVLLPALFLAIILLLRNPISLILIGAVAQGVMLPLLAGLALHLRYRRTDVRLRPGRAWTAFLWAAFFSMLLVGVYQAWEGIAGFLRGQV